jgi:membrane protein DedA with SNARE-associated domain
MVLVSLGCTDPRLKVGVNERWSILFSEASQFLSNLKNSKVRLTVCGLALLACFFITLLRATASESTQASSVNSSTVLSLQDTQPPHNSFIRNLIINNSSTPLLIFALLALATLITEDLTCVWAGAMIAEGRISFLAGTLACLVGIFGGDLLLFLAGRVLGRPALARAPLKWFVNEVAVERGSAWFKRRGMAAIAISRFMPGTRLPTYVAAGLLDTNIWKFSLYFLIAATIWTPLLVAGSMLVGRELIESTLLTEQSFLIRAVVIAVPLFILVRLIMQLATFRSRRLLVGRLRRLQRWEFWPMWLFYPPVVLYILYLGIRFKSLTLFTCVNPAIEASGFVGESKFQILSGLSRDEGLREYIPLTGLLQGSASSQIDQAKRFMVEASLNYPVVLKPDAGERGFGVSIIRSDVELAEYLFTSTGDAIIQQYAPGHEFGVFYCRLPNESVGKIFSITRKLFPVLVGDGRQTLETLILKDKRAVCMAHSYFSAQKGNLLKVPRAGETIQLIEIGTHSRGSIFLDGGELKNPTLEAAIDCIAEGFAGFYFGRFDIRTPSITDFQSGTNFKIVELNGVTSEATSIYDPKNSLGAAYKVLFQQWRIAFEIGAENQRRGWKPTSLRELLNLVRKTSRRTTERFVRDLRLRNQEAVNS